MAQIFAHILDWSTKNHFWFSLRFLFLFTYTLLGGILAALGYGGVLPFTIEYWFFYSLILFLFSLWRPNLAFLLFVALLPLEMTGVTPIEWEITLRPYQWVALFLGLALAVRFASGRLKWPLFSLNKIDISLSVFLLGVIISGIVHGEGALKQSLIVASFVYLYFLSRIFLATQEAVMQALPFFVIPATGSLLWGLLQNILFLQGYSSWAVMPGRPNGTLPEPDWLGLFIIFLLSTSLAWLIRHLVSQKEIFLQRLIGPTFWCTFLFLLLILTVSRSAWLGAGVAIFVGTAILLAPYKQPWRYQASFLLMQILAVVFGVALFLVVSIPLTRFPLFDRAISTASHEQTITIACNEVVDSLPSSIEHMEDLPALYGCTHINLEEIPLKKNEGKWVTTIKRPDPNVEIRSAIYAQSLAAGREHPLLGIGWGNIGPRLGVDERGASYNASNLWLEIWLGGGVIALLGFLVAMVLLVRQLKRWRESEDLWLLGLALGAALIGFLVFNLFNTGLLLGFVWVYLATFSITDRSQSTSTEKI